LPNNQNQPTFDAMTTIIHAGECPKCGRVVSSCRIENITAFAGIGGATYKAISYSCSSCKAILSVQMDPIALENDLVNRLLQELKPY
jgi:MinD superfamily P-loop ATPase